MDSELFVDRRRELAVLDRFCNRRGAGLLVVYGRRRIGKTKLLTHWIEQRFPSEKSGQAFYWMATTHSAAYQLSDFTDEIFKHAPPSGIPSRGFAFKTWEDAFDYIGHLAETRKAHGPFVAILDEFTFLVQSDENVASLLQRAWDSRLSKIPTLRLIISGSLVGMMERNVLAAQAPLYGRAAEILKLRPLEFGTLVEIFPEWSAAERVAAFAVCGGIPAYLGLFAQAKIFTDGLKNYALAPNSILFTDSSLLLHERLGDTAIYESVLSVIARGEHEWSQISERAKMNDDSLGYYLQTLQSLEWVKRDDPVMTRSSGRRGGRRGRYYLNDPFLRFYYRFIVPNRAALQRGLVGRTVETLVDDLRGFIGTYVFEDLCRDWVLVQAEAGRLGWQPEEYGSYWRRKKNERVQLDVVAVSSRAKRLLVGEAKWTEAPIGRGILTDLVERSKRLVIKSSDEDTWGSGSAYLTEYVYFSRAGFTAAARAEAKQMRATLVDLAMVEKAHLELVEMGR